MILFSFTDNENDNSNNTDNISNNIHQNDDNNYNYHQDITFREVYIGGISSNVTESLLIEFLNSALERLCLKNPSTNSNSIVQCTLQSRFALIEFQTTEDATNCLNLSGIPFMGNTLRISRPLTFTGPCIKYFTWKELAQQWIDGDIKIKISGLPSPIIQLSNMILLTDVYNPVITEEVLWDLNEECQQCGDILSIKLEPNTGNFFVQMDSIESSTKALVLLKGRTYDSRVVDVNYFPNDIFLSACISDPTATMITIPPISNPPIILASSGPITLDDIIGVRSKQEKI